MGFLAFDVDDFQEKAVRNTGSRNCNSSPAGHTFRFMYVLFSEPMTAAVVGKFI